MDANLVKVASAALQAHVDDVGDEGRADVVDLASERRKRREP